MQVTAFLPFFYLNVTRICCTYVVSEYDQNILFRSVCPVLLYVPRKNNSSPGINTKIWKHDKEFPDLTYYYMIIYLFNDKQGSIWVIAYTTHLEKFVIFPGQKCCS